MDLSTLKPAPGARRRRKRIGRGIGSGHGKTAGRGHKGKGSRSGGNTPAGYEGGQMPLQRRLPKRGFRRLIANEARRRRVAVVNLMKLAKLDDADEVTPQTLAQAGLIAAGQQVKILGEGEISRALKISAHAFSRAARQKIIAAGGSTVVIGAG